MSDYPVRGVEVKLSKARCIEELVSDIYHLLDIVEVLYGEHSPMMKRINVILEDPNSTGGAGGITPYAITKIKPLVKDDLVTWSKNRLMKAHRFFNFSSYIIVDADWRMRDHPRLGFGDES